LKNEPEGKVSGNPFSKSCDLLKELGTSMLASVCCQNVKSTNFVAQDGLGLV